MSEKKKDYKEYWDANPEAKELFVASDGQVFAAIEHADSYGLKYDTIKRPAEAKEKEGK